MQAMSGVCGDSFHGFTDLNRCFAWCVVLPGIALVARNLMILIHPNQ
jgi:hypothetical protein